MSAEKETTPVEVTSDEEMEPAKKFKSNPVKNIKFKTKLISLFNFEGFG